MLALPEVPRQLEKAVKLERRRVSVLQSLYSTDTDEIMERLNREEREAKEPGISDQLRRVREGRAAITRRELETYMALKEEKETIDALLDSIESFLRRLSFRTISTEEVQAQIAEIDESLAAHDKAMAELREELRQASEGSVS
jgi:chromosome segregation ATPase